MADNTVHDGRTAMSADWMKKTYTVKFKSAGQLYVCLNVANLKPFNIVLNNFIQ